MGRWAQAQRTGKVSALQLPYWITNNWWTQAGGYWKANWAANLVPDRFEVNYQKFIAGWVDQGTLTYMGWTTNFVTAWPTTDHLQFRVRAWSNGAWSAWSGWADSGA